MRISTQKETIQSVTLTNIHGSEIKELSFDRGAGILRIDLSQENIPDGMYWLLLRDREGVAGIARLIYQSAR